MPYIWKDKRKRDFNVVIFREVHLLPELRKILPCVKGKWYLYGSYARGTARRNSDVDVCLLVDKLPSSYVHLNLPEKVLGIPLQFAVYDNLDPEWFGKALIRIF